MPAGVRVESYFRIRLAELVLLLLILLNVFDFFSMLPEDISFVKEILSIVLMASLFYHVGITWLFFGAKADESSGVVKNWFVNLVIVFSYLAFLAKNVVSITSEAGSQIFSGIFLFFSTFGVQIERISFYFGAVMLLLVSLYLAFFSVVHERSFLGNIHVGKSRFVKFIAIFLALNAFYILVFDLVMEWLAVAVDNTLIVSAIFVYLFFIVRHHRKFSADNFIYKIGSFSERFYEHAIRFFHDKQHIFLGISGLLVLHLITEISNFILPYIFNRTSSMYFEMLGHRALYSLWAESAVSSPVFVSFAYVFNIASLFMLMLMPAFIWHELYVNKKEGIPCWLLALFFCALPSFFLAPAFSLVPITGGVMEKTGLVGVDIVANSISAQNLEMIIVLSLVFGAVLFACSLNAFLKRLEYHAVIIVSLAFLFYYLYLFYFSVFSYYLVLIPALASEWFFVFYFALFFVLKILFAVLGSFKLLAQVVKSHLL
jgi:hypothetical protein